MSQPITLERIGLFGALKFGFVLGAFLALLGGILVMFFYWIAAAQVSRSLFATTLPGFGQVLVSIVLYIIFAAILYAISVWLLAVIYNFVAAVSGGLIFHVSGINLASPAQLPMVAPAAVAPLYNSPAQPGAMPGVVPQSAAPAAVSPPPASINPMPASVAQAPASQAGAWFIGVSNPTLRVALTRPVTRIGSAAGNDLVVASHRVAGYHAEIRLENGRFIVYDVSNGFGVTVNGRAIPQSNMLKNGFNVALGDATFVFQQ